MAHSVGDYRAVYGGRTRGELVICDPIALSTRASEVRQASAEQWSGWAGVRPDANTAVPVGKF
jgi:hypothetical protein